MRNIKDLQGNECILCDTQEEWDRILLLFGEDTIISSRDWGIYKNKSVIYGQSGRADQSYAKSNGHTVYVSQDFLTEKDEQQTYTLEQVKKAVDNWAVMGIPIQNIAQLLSRVNKESKPQSLK